MPFEATSHNPWTLWLILLSVTTFLSVSGLSYLAWKKHIPAMTKPLSELAVEDPQSLAFFRIVLITCSTLFAISMYGFVIPRAGSNGLQFVAWTVTYISALLLAILPAHGKTLHWHNLFAMFMFIGMLDTAVLFSLSTDLSVVCRELCRYISILMGALAVLMLTG